jgi:hypothetical protein
MGLKFKLKSGTASSCKLRLMSRGSGLSQILLRTLFLLEAAFFASVTFFFFLMNTGLWPCEV